MDQQIPTPHHRYERHADLYRAFLSLAAAIICFNTKGRFCLASEIGKDGQRRYRIIDGEEDAAGEPG